MVEVTIPGLTEFVDVDLTFLQLQRNSPEIFLGGVEIGSVYGGFAGSKFCGGRNNFGALMDLEEAAQLIASYNAFGVGCNLTFTNQFVNEAALQESSYSTSLLHVFDNGGPNGVIVYASALEAYIRRKHPRLKLISSTTKGLQSLDEIEMECKDHDRVVLDYNLTRDEVLISRLQHLEKVEVMLNEYCTLGCPMRAAHYRHVSLDQIAGKQTPFECVFASGDVPAAAGFLNGLLEESVFLRKADMMRYESRYGIVNFKIVGRGLNRYDVTDSYLYYLIKPEYWYEVRDMLARTVSA